MSEKKYLLLVVSFLICLVAESQDYWVQTNFPDSSDAVNINAEKEGVVLVSSYDGLYRSLDEGVSWTIINPLRIWAMVYSSSSDLFVSTGDGFMMSTDDGESYSSLADTEPVFKLRIAPN